MTRLLPLLALGCAGNGPDSGPTSSPEAFLAAFEAKTCAAQANCGSSECQIVPGMYEIDVSGCILNADAASECLDRVWECRDVVDDRQIPVQPAACDDALPFCYGWPL